MKNSTKTSTQARLQKGVSLPIVVTLVIVAALFGWVLASKSLQKTNGNYLTVSSPSPTPVETLTYEMIPTPDTSTWKSVKYPGEKIQFRVPQDWMIEVTGSSTLIGKTSDISGMASRPQNDVGLYVDGIKSMVSFGGMLNESIPRQEIMVEGYKAYFGTSDANDFSEVEIPLRDRLKLIMMVENKETLPTVKGILSTLEFK